MKEYKSFASKEARNEYVCKSEITRELLRKMHISDYVSVESAKESFDNIRRDYIIVPTGSKTDKKKTRHTKFVKKNILYDAIIKGRRFH